MYYQKKKPFTYDDILTDGAIIQSLLSKKSLFETAFKMSIEFDYPRVVDDRLWSVKDVYDYLLNAGHLFEREGLLSVNESVFDEIHGLPKINSIVFDVLDKTKELLKRNSENHPSLTIKEKDLVRNIMTCRI